MYKIKIMDIKKYQEIIFLWKNTEGIGLNDCDDSKKSIKKYLERNPGTCFIAEYNSEIIGTAMGGHDGRRGLIYHLMVKPEHRRKGIGKKLLDEAEKSLKKKGIRRIYLSVFTENDTGNKFWENNGYVIREPITFRSKSLV